MVTFEIKCYEKDWRFVLLTGRIERLIQICNYPFVKRILYINNVKSSSEVGNNADKLVKKKIIDEYVFVKDYEKVVLDFFGLTRDEFQGGYYYSISELTAIYLCSSEYLLHFSSDAMLNHSTYPWVKSAIDVMSTNKNVLVGFPNYHLAQEESIQEDKDWYYGYGFTDQCYLIRTADFRQRIYTEHNPISERYPKYGGELFEKRVDAYMRNHGKYRMSSKHISYFHKNYPSSTISRNIEFLKHKFLGNF